MNIVIIGQGAIGLLWYHHLAKISTNAVSLACSSRTKAIPSHYRFTDLDKQSALLPLTAANNTTFAEAELILVCVKSYQVSAAVQAFNNKITSEAVIVFCHNGMGAFDDISSLSQAACALLTTHGCKINRPFHAQHTGTGHNDLGLISGSVAASVRDNIAATLTQALPTLALTDNIKAKQWLKLAINCVINPLTAIDNIDNGQLLNDKYQQIVTALINEVIAVARLEGIKFEAKSLEAKVWQVATDTASNCSSMRSDILRQRKTEINYINGYLVNLAKKHGILVPENEKLLQQIKALEP